MNTKLLIDSIVRQTTVMIAQLSTAAGIRAPLSHVADQVFLELSREIENQGVSRKVAADMFGIALRTYQKKVQRLTESATERDRTLWEAMLDYLSTSSRTRAAILHRFKGDGPEHVGSVLKDLAASGFVYSTGRGDSAVFGLTTAEDRRVLVESEDLDSLAHMVWLKLFQEPGQTAEDIARTLALKPERVSRAIEQLLADGRIVLADTGYRSSNVVIPIGAQQGWEAAVFDHFRAVTTAIAAKLQSVARAQSTDTVGGATLTFTLHAHHPYRSQVVGLLARMRKEMNELWDEVSDYNRKYPPADEEAEKVTFYFGQSTEDLK